MLHRLWAWSLFVVVSVACASEDPVVERRGGALPDPSQEPVGASGAPSGSDGGSSGDSDGAIPYCAALEVVRVKCQRCHSDPPAHGAPVPLVTYEDFQAPYGSSRINYGQAAIRLVEEDAMPYVLLNEPPASLMPPVEPLTVEEKATLLGWLEQGARPAGGTDCP